MDDSLVDIKWSGQRATSQDVEEAEAALRVRIPEELVTLLVDKGAGEGPIGRGHLNLVPVQDWVRINATLQTDVKWPGLVVIGGDGGGFFYAFDTHGRYLLLDGTGDYVGVVGSSLNGLLAFVADPERGLP